MDNVIKAVSPEDLEKANEVVEAKKDPQPQYFKKVPKEKTVQLEYGFELDGVKYSQVKISPFMGHHWSELRDNFEHGDAAMIVTISDMPAKAVKCLFGDDYVNVLNECEEMMPKKLRAKMMEMASEQTPETGPNT